MKSSSTFTGGRGFFFFSLVCRRQPGVRDCRLQYQDGRYQYNRRKYIRSIYGIGILSFRTLLSVGVELLSQLPVGRGTVPPEKDEGVSWKCQHLFSER